MGTGHVFATHLGGMLQRLHQLTATDPGVIEILAEGKHCDHISFRNGARFAGINRRSNS